MGVARPLIGRGSGVATHHLPRPPAGQPHQVVLLPARGEPVVRERVAELVRMNGRNPCVMATPFQHLS